MVAEPTSDFFFARLLMTDAPSMPMKTHIMTRMHWVTLCATEPRPVLLAAMITALRCAVPQKSAVKTPALKLTTAKTMKRRMAAHLTTMTTAFDDGGVAGLRVGKHAG